MTFPSKEKADQVARALGRAWTAGKQARSKEFRDLINDGRKQQRITVI